MKNASLIVLITFACMSLLMAADEPLARITVILWRKENNRMNDAFKLATLFAREMDAIGQETARYSEERLAALRPDQFEDRIRLIALDRLRHPELFEEIFKTYLKHPTQEEIERRRVGILDSYAGKISQEE